MHRPYRDIEDSLKKFTMKTEVTYFSLKMFFHFQLFLEINYFPSTIREISKSHHNKRIRQVDLRRLRRQLRVLLIHVISAHIQLRAVISYWFSQALQSSVVIYDLQLK